MRFGLPSARNCLDNFPLPQSVTQIVKISTPAYRKRDPIESFESVLLIQFVASDSSPYDAHVVVRKGQTPVEIYDTVSKRNVITVEIALIQSAFEGPTSHLSKTLREINKYPFESPNRLAGRRPPIDSGAETIYIDRAWRIGDFVKDARCNHYGIEDDSSRIVQNYHKWFSECLRLLI